MVSKKDRGGKVYHSEGGTEGSGSSMGAALAEAAKKANVDVGSIGGPPSPEALAAMAKRLIEGSMENLKSPEEMAVEREKARQMRIAERQRIAQIVSALSTMDESTKTGFLRALQNDYLLANRPERTLTDEERKALATAQKVLGTYKSWPQQVQRLFQQGFPLKSEAEARVAELETQKAAATDPDVLEQIEGKLEQARADLAVSVESEELHQGFLSWKKTQDAARDAARQHAQSERRDAMTAFYQDTVPLDIAIANGVGESCVWVNYTVKYRTGDDNRLVPMIDDNKKPIQRNALLKVRVVGARGFVSAKFDRNPPHIPVDPDRLIELNPEEDFNTPKGQPRWNEDMQKALVKTYAECRQKTLEAEERANLEAYLKGIEEQGTITVTEIFDAFSAKKGRKTGVIAINNPSLRLNPNDPRSRQFHLAFTLDVRAKGVCHIGPEFYSSEKGVDLTPLLGRELVLEMGEDSLLHLRDPNLPSVDGLEGDELEAARQARGAITRACGRVFGSLRAKKRYEASQAAPTPSNAEEVKEQEPQAVPV